MKKIIIIASLFSFMFLTSCKDDKSDKTPESDTALVEKQNWKMVTTWPSHFPVLGEIAEKYAKWVEELTEGQIKVKVYAAGELVPAFGAFEAVSSGTCQIGAATPYYWIGKSPSAKFFSSIPFGMNAVNTAAWLEIGGGYELWKELYSKYNLVPFIGGNTGMQTGGWFNKKIETINDFKGLKMRMPGLGGKVLEKVGGTPVLLPGGEIYTSLERGVIDATEWIGPYHDYKMGFHKVAKYYYLNGWHEPSLECEFFINKTVFDKLPKHLQIALEIASHKAQNWMLYQFASKNGEFLEKIKQEGVELKYFSDDVLRVLKESAEKVIQEEIADDPMSKRIYKSYNEFREKVTSWTILTEKQDIKFSTLK